jgi:hypothetical protein
MRWWAGRNLPIVQCLREFAEARSGASFNPYSATMQANPVGHFGIHWDTVLAQAAISGLFAVLRTRHDADRSVGKVAAFLALPQ